MMYNANIRIINFIMNKNNNLSEDKQTIFKELIIKYLLKKIVGENLNGT